MLGAPASGKGTQAARLAGYFELPKLSTGALIRAEQSAGSDLGVLADRYLAGGGFLPDELILQVMDRWLDDQGSEGFVLDGFPRTLPQAERFEATLASAGHQLDAAILLESELGALRQRCATRVHCSVCGGTFQVGSPSDLSAGDACPEGGCSGVLASRPDDDAEIYAGRLANYQKLTEPLIEHFSRNSVLKRIDGSRSPDAVFEQILASLSVPTTASESNPK